MAATKHVIVPYKDEVIQPYAVKTATAIWQGSFVAVDSTGYLIECPANVGAGNSFVGVAADGCVATTGDGAVSVPVLIDGLHYVTVTGADQTKIGAAVYVTDSATLTITDPGSGVKVGKIANYSGESGKAWVRFYKQ